jgi:hypothetical protein
LSDSDVARPLGPETVDQIRQGQQVGRGEWAAAIGDHDERIDRSEVCPTRGQREQLTVLVVEMNPILTPVPAVHDELELPLKQWVEPMSHSDKMMPIVQTRCS